MKFCRDTSLAARAVYISCVKCSRRLTLDKVWADRDGAAFEDYYCEPCAEYYATPGTEWYANGVLITTTERSSF